MKHCIDKKYCFKTQYAIITCSLLKKYAKLEALCLYTGNLRVAQRDWLAWLLACRSLDDYSTRRDDTARWWCVIG